ncbi:hypothetical protein HME9304_01596 [Flagellimonas maritima]|uniref:TonB-dependent receptor plug domain-containing protein n=1 Tax=Flagellimonas maritima TaxID=1383885 RepID=A0A2Z4LRY8_9FLAO|nr:TonB-dependent receptor plug domain-containing protein [Allomuricauda aurantiaca]AWX44593.1 hypothetical protein HME9304_01596 [Allomuricauda aurantiaca]
MGRNGFFFIFIMFLVSSVDAQENPRFKNIINKLSSYTTKHGPEKVYAHIDKEFYNQGDTIWFKIYLVDGISHLSSDKSNVVYVELLDSEDNIVVQRKLFVEDMDANGDIVIPETLKDGKYKLRAYSKYMLNENEPILFSKHILIANIENDSEIKNVSPKAQEKPIVQFFPEGGNLVSGINTNLAIKTTNTEGVGIPIKGKILNQNNKVISLFESSDYGLGSLSFKPELGETYYAYVTVDGKEHEFSIPIPLKEGYVLNAKNNGEHLLLKISTNHKIGLKGALLIGHLRGQTFFKRILESNEATYSVKILTENIEDGVAHFTLFTPEAEPVCERLLFINHPKNDAVLSVKTNSKTYAFREKIEVELDLKDKEGNPLYGNLSSSISRNTNQSLRQNTNITSWLLLNSEIGNTFLDTDQLLKDINTSKKHLLDLLMLTNGWRRFVWKELLKNKVSKELSYKPEKGLMITGKTTSFTNKYNSKASSVTLSIFEDPFFQGENSTNLQGQFSFGPFIFYDTINAFVEAKPLKHSRKTKDNELAIQLDRTYQKIQLKEKFLPKNEQSTKEEEVQLLNEYRQSAPQFELSSKITRLKEVTVKAKKKTRKEIIDEKIRKFTIYASPDNRVFKDSMFGIGALNIFDLLINVPGIRVIGYFPNQEIQVRNAYSVGGGNANGGDEGTDESNTGSERKGPLYLLDGFQVSLALIQTFNPAEVEFIDVLKGPSAAIYGVRGSNGVIAVYTRGRLNTNLENEENEQPDVLSVKINGFYKAREFFSPNYRISKPAHKQKDYRTTLHWEPNIETNNEGKSTFDFFTGDIPGAYTITTEGISFDGRPVSVSHSFKVDIGF